MADYTPKYTKM